MGTAVDKRFKGRLLLEKIRTHNNFKLAQVFENAKRERRRKAVDSSQKQAARRSETDAFLLYSVFFSRFFLL
jgi:hypothetical protein